jgi:hypothetical protein
MQNKVVLHVDRGGSKFACIPRPYALYKSEVDFGNCAKKGILSLVSEIYRVYTQMSRFFTRIPDPALVFEFRHSDRKVITEPSRYIERYPCSYLTQSATQGTSASTRTFLYSGPKS